VERGVGACSPQEKIADRTDIDLQLKNGIILYMNSKNRKTLEAIFAVPVRPGVERAEIEAVFTACGGVPEEARGSRVCVEINGVVAHFHRPHPQPDTDKGAVKSVRRFLENAGVTPHKHTYMQGLPRRLKILG
jgi:hypothetical protein